MVENLSSRCLPVLGNTQWPDENLSSRCLPGLGNTQWPDERTFLQGVSRAWVTPNGQTREPFFKVSPGPG
ncbi:hypothetical protein Bpfe_026407 [Biomphalaria pfeifferi]|uniref:Uncharacterized protein n=1 Tax=Biomphalaria pfeifferi TaxID=112525 RepID=A0AAD8AYX3_BIOPF|nr:hypothetical protein Bpfe_026407 [Biomphalaria pfeifferi]